MKKTHIIAITFFLLASLVALSNTSLGVFVGKPLIHVYHFESSNREFAEAEVPEKGRSLQIVEKQFEDYKKLSGKSNVQLCRTFRKNPLKFYEWSNFIVNKRWNYPYIKPSENPVSNWRSKYKNSN